MNAAVSSLYVVRVLPIVSGFRDSEATYFSSTPFTAGAVVTVPFRSKEKAAVVLSSTNVAHERSEIKRADFGLRKIKKQKERFLFHPLFLNAVHRLALHYAATPGEILSALVPTVVREEHEAFNIESPRLKRGAPTSKQTKRIFVQGSDKVQLTEIKREIERSLKKHTSVLILAPTTSDAKRLFEALSPHFSDKITEISSRLTTKNQKKRWNDVSERKDAQVVVVTTGFVSIPLSTIGLFIIYRSSSGLYSGQRKPHLDGRVVLEALSKEFGAPLMSTDVYISVQETKVKEYPALDVLPLSGDVRIIDMANLVKTTEERLKNEFVLFSKELLSDTEHFLDAGKNVFWFVARRGLYPSTVCRDCGTEHTCSRCGSALVLHEKKVEKKKGGELTGNENRFFLCHRCGEREKTLVTCRNCNSWRLLPLGIGLDGVVEKAEELGLRPLVLSRDRTPTKKSVKEILLALEKQSGARGQLLVGTDLALSVLESPIALSAIVSMDSRLAVPSYNAEESALATLLSVASLGEELCIVQTRRAKHRIFNHAQGDGLARFRKEETQLRRTFLYPPFGTLIEISNTARKEKVEKWMNLMSADLLGLIDSSTESVIRFPLRGTKKKDYYKGSVVIKLSRPLEKRPEMRTYLAHLSPSMQIKVDPENLW